MNFRNVFVVIALASAPFASFANCNGLLPIVAGQGYQTGSRSPCWSGNQQTGQVVAVVATRPQVAQYVEHAERERRIPPNCRIVRKSFWERVANGAQTALLDAAVGALGGAAVDSARHTGGQWTNVGMNAGAALGFAEGSADGLTIICQTDEQQTNQEKKKVEPSSCQIDGVAEDFRGLSKEQCAQKASSLKKTVPAEVRRESVPAERPLPAGQDDLWKWKDGSASVGNPGKCVVERLTGESKPPFCSELKALPRQTGEDRGSWRIRAEKA